MDSMPDYHRPFPIHHPDPKSRSERLGQNLNCPDLREHGRNLNCPDLREHGQNLNCPNPGEQNRNKQDHHI